MSSQGEGGAGPGDGRDMTLAVLATRLSELSGRVGELAVGLQTAQAAIAGQAATIAETAGLAREVTRLSQAIAGNAGAEPGEYPAGGHPRVPPWAAMDDDLYVDSLRDLARWVADILLIRYPHARTVLSPCWPAHPAAVEELDWLYWDWTGWAGDPDARARDAADWHDRWLPGVLARLEPRLADCARNGGNHVKPVYDRAVPPELQLDDAAPEQVFIENMGRARSLDGELVGLGDRRPGSVA